MAESQGTPVASAGAASKEDMVSVFGSTITPFALVVVDNMFCVEVDPGAEPVSEEEPRKDLHFIRQTSTPDTGAVVVFRIPSFVKRLVSITGREGFASCLQNTFIFAVVKVELLQVNQKSI